MQHLIVLVYKSPSLNFTNSSIQYVPTICGDYNTVKNTNSIYYRVCILYIYKQVQDTELHALRLFLVKTLVISVKTERAQHCIESSQTLRLCLSFDIAILNSKQSIDLILNMNTFGGNGEGHKVYRFHFRLYKLNFFCKNFTVV